MIVRQQKRGYTSNRKYVYGSGFSDTIKSIASYVVQNKDLIAKPLLGAVGNLAAAGLTEGGKALLTHMLNRKNKIAEPKLDPKSESILQSIINSSNSDVPVTNIVGSGRTGGGIKKF